MPCLRIARRLQPLLASLVRVGLRLHCCKGLKLRVSLKDVLLNAPLTEKLQTLFWRCCCNLRASLTVTHHSRHCKPFVWRFHIIISQGVENTGSLWIEAGDAWATRGSWDNTISGEASVCIYNNSDAFDNACAEVRTWTANAFELIMLCYAVCSSLAKARA